MRVRGIHIDGGSAGRLRIEPRPHGTTVIPVDLPLEAEALARALRETLGARRRDSLCEIAPVLEVHLGRGGDRILVQDQSTAGRRVLVESPAAGPEKVLSADTHSPTDLASPEHILQRIPRVFELETWADLAPSLARSGNSEPANPSPKQLAYQRSFEELRAIARNLESIDRTLATSPQPNWLQVATVVGGAALAAASISVLVPRSAGVVLALTVVGMLIYLARLGFVALQEIKRRETLPVEAAELRPALEAARERHAELAETLRRRGEDPDEILGRLLAPPRLGLAPSFLARASVSWAELLSLEARDGQALVFVSGGNAGGDDFGGRVRRPEPLPDDASALGGFERE